MQCDPAEDSFFHQKNQQCALFLYFYQKLMDTALQGFEVLGRIGSTCVYYRLAGHQDLDYELYVVSRSLLGPAMTVPEQLTTQCYCRKLTITDFRGEAWMSRFSLQSFLESDCLVRSMEACCCRFPEKFLQKVLTAARRGTSQTWTSCCDGSLPP